MALAHFQRTFTDASGNVKPWLSVTVRRESDNGLAALFSDAGSVTPKSNPFNTDANGYGSFYVTDGRYRIQATDIDWRDTDIFISPTFYAQLAGGPLANFTAMPQVGGDPIVESGSNADGEWTRWSDGTVVMSGLTTTESCTAIYSVGGFYNSMTCRFTYPSAVITVPNISCVANREGGSGALRLTGSAVSMSTDRALLRGVAQSSGQDINFYVVAHGRWK